MFRGPGRNMPPIRNVRLDRSYYEQIYEVSQSCTYRGDFLRVFYNFYNIITLVLFYECLVT